MASQVRRLPVDAALRNGRVAAWEYTPPAGGSQKYMHNHLDLNDIERSAAPAIRCTTGPVCRVSPSAVPLRPARLSGDRGVGQRSGEVSSAR